MPESIELTRHDLLALARPSLAALRAALLRDAGPSAASYLQEAGYAGGETLYASFRDWLRDRDKSDPEALPSEEFDRHATEYFREAGWGSLRIASIGDAAATLDSDDWGEADPASQLDFPGCHLSTGMFADFFGRLAGSPVSVLEVECRSMGAPRCRFLLGSIEVMEHVYDAMGRGLDYQEALESVS